MNQPNFLMWETSNDSHCQKSMDSVINDLVKIIKIYKKSQIAIIEIP